MSSETVNINSNEVKLSITFVSIFLLLKIKDTQIMQWKQSTSHFIIESFSFKTKQAILRENVLPKNMVKRFTPNLHHLQFTTQHGAITLCSNSISQVLKFCSVKLAASLGRQCKIYLREQNIKMSSPCGWNLSPWQCIQTPLQIICDSCLSSFDKAITRTLQKFKIFFQPQGCLEILGRLP